MLLGNRNGQNLFDLMAGLKASRPDLRIIVTGSGTDEETILKALAAGAKGYVDEAASPTGVCAGHPRGEPGISVGAAPRALHVHRARQLRSPGRIFPAGPRDLHRP